MFCILLILTSFPLCDIMSIYESLSRLPLTLILLARVGYGSFSFFKFKTKGRFYCLVLYLPKRILYRRYGILFLCKGLDKTVEWISHSTAITYSVNIFSVFIWRYAHIFFEYSYKIVCIRKTNIFSNSIYTFICVL